MRLQLPARYSARYSLAIAGTLALACAEPTAPADAPAPPVAASEEIAAPDGGGDPAADRTDAGQDPESPTFRERDGFARPPAGGFSFPELDRPLFSRPVVGQVQTIDGAELAVGSHPADGLRVQFAEMDLAPRTLTAFEIDALPYPNDPDRPFLTGVSRFEAERLCAERGQRLCSELEWELACKSTDGRRYPIGNHYDPTAYPDGDPMQPASPTGVFAMGRLLEWTSSRWGIEPDQVERVAVRGHWDDPEVRPEVGRRCAMRRHRTADVAEEGLGFRCCTGPVNEAFVEIEATRPPFSLYNNMKPDKFAAVITSIPEIGAVHDNPHMFSDADVRAVLARRSTDREDQARQGIHFRWKPIRWIPRQGTELWVAVGRSNRHAFVVALHEVVDNEEYVHGSSLILWNQPAPLALAYREGHRDELYWAPCWGCRDGGSIAWDDERNEVVITHKW